jgi:outer membrane protein OmpA-like peptidoglycan-associated protein
MASGLFLALGFADLAVLNLVLAPQLAHQEAARCADGQAQAAATSGAATSGVASHDERPASAVEASPTPAAIASGSPPLPSTPAAPKPVAAIPDVTFALGDIRVTSQGVLASVRRLARTLADEPDKRLLVRGHSDKLGSLAENRVLSWQRAEAVTRILAMAGAPLDRITIEAAGPAEPADPDDTPTGWAKNRRVQLLWR